VNRTRMLIGVTVVVLLIAMTLGADATKKPKGVFSALKVGQSVSLKDEGSAFTLTVFEPDLPQSHKVIEVGDNFIVVRDIAGISDTTIPVFSLKSIVKVGTNKP
jgi:hypothetical protein